MGKQHKRWKGCCMMCAAWIRGDGKYRRMPGRDLRKSGGKKSLKHKLWKKEED